MSIEIFKYMKFSAMALIYTPAIIYLLLQGGGWALLVPLCVITLQIVFDNALEKDASTQKYKHLWFLNTLVYIQVPLTYLAVFVLVWQVAPGDLFGFGQWIENTVGWEVLEKHQQFTLLDGIIAATACGFYFSVSTLIGHELTHRLDSPFAMLVGRWILAIVGDSQFSISHVYAHHKNVATEADAATARRGENLYRFFLRSSAGQYREAWQFEAGRLRNQRKAVFSLRNRVITGLIMTASIWILIGWLGGWQAALCYFIFMFVAKFLFESVNYIEHYGLVRVPGTRVEPRHSWDCRNVMSSYNYLNLTRHSDHHASARKPYWQLSTQEDAMDLQYGYMFYILLAMFPPLFHQVIVPRLKQWDQQCATPLERVLANEANVRSGLIALQELSDSNIGTAN